MLFALLSVLKRDGHAGIASTGYQSSTNHREGGEAFHRLFIIVIAAAILSRHYSSQLPQRGVDLFAQCCRTLPIRA